MDNFQQNQQLNETKQSMNTGTSQYSVSSHPKFTSTLIFAVIELMCCNTLTGIIALILAIIGDSDWKKGRPIDADEKFKGAKIALIVGLILGIFAYITIACIYGVGILAAIAESM